MDGQRLVHLLYSDAPRVARALVDCLRGRAKARSGIVGNVPFVQLACAGVNSVVIRGDDWRKIFPLIRYGSGNYRPVTPPGIEPDPIMSPQPNRTMPTPPVNPGDGFTSFLAGFPFAEYAEIQRLLPMSNVGKEPPGNVISTQVPEPIQLNPLPGSFDQSAWSEVYDRLVAMLQELFPKDFPTSEV